MAIKGSREPCLNRQPTAARPPVRELKQRVASIDERFATLSMQFELLKAQVRQAQQVSSLGAATAMIAHEVNNLLTPILSFADVALQSRDPELARKALTVTARNARMLVAMSERMLELGAARPQHREPANLHQAVGDALASLCRDLDKDGIALSLQIEDNLCVLADPLQLRQILFNLFLNAREAMAGGHSGRLTVIGKRQLPDPHQGPGVQPLPTTHDRSAVPMVSIEIRNTGPCIPAELLPHIFEPFQSGKSSLRNGKTRCGGLGLALVRDLVEENGGSIEVASAPGAPTTFTIRLPAA